MSFVRIEIYFDLIGSESEDTKIQVIAHTLLSYNYKYVLRNWLRFVSRS